MLQVATAFGFGIFTGAMLLIGGAIVPYWFSLEPSAFLAWFGRNAPFIGGVMVPLGGTTTGLSLVTAALSWRARGAERGFFLLAAGFAIVIALIYGVEHAALNDVLLSGALSEAEVEPALERWRAWHWARVVAGAAGFIAALVGITRSER